MTQTALLVLQIADGLAILPKNVSMLYQTYLSDKAKVYGILINADLMREVDLVWPNDWEKPKELQRMYNEYKTEQR